MQRLFWKIFLWFWLGMVVVSATLVVSTALTRSRSREDEQWRQRYALPVDLRAQRTAELFCRGGAPAVEKYLVPLERRDPMRDYLFDQTGRDILGQQPPPNVIQVLALMRRLPAGEHYFFSNQRIAAESTRASDGGTFTLIMTFPPRPVFPSSIFEFLFTDVGRGGAVRLIAMLLVAAFFCFWLARHITSPIENLRLVTYEIAHERLGARVDERVTGRRDELADLGADFNRMAQRIDNLVTNQRQLLADVSHELRSPLARLNVALGLARQRAAPETSEHLDRIEQETNRLNKLIGQLLTLARMNSGADLQRKRVFDLSALVQEIAADGDYEARARQATVELSAPSGCAIEGSPEMLRGAIENVIRNAVRHTAQGTKVELTVQCQHGADQTLVRVQVRDHGPGVPEEEVGKLFLPFHRLTNGASRCAGGAGLGLAITERAVRLHGGHVTAANAPTGGLIVTLELPGLASACPPPVESGSIL
jgi:two-component system, OmpR family, sensor histidine kinase CpxA